MLVSTTRINVPGADYNLRAWCHTIGQMKISICFVERWMAWLSFPPTDVFKGLQFLKEICPSEGEELLVYVDVTYVNGPFKKTKTGDMAFRIKRVPPPFPPSVWTVHSATLLDCNRRNNLCEGWNTCFQHLVVHHHPTIWKLIEALQQENSSVYVMIAQAMAGNPPEKRVLKVYVDLQKRLES